MAVFSATGISWSIRRGLKPAAALVGPREDGVHGTTDGVRADPVEVAGVPTVTSPSWWLQAPTKLLYSSAVGTRYVEVQAKSILNPVLGMGFRWSANPYRGCVHGCHYC